MCAAKKSDNRVDLQKEEQGRSAPRRKLTGLPNPLPDEEVGPGLLVRLQAEHVISKLKLSEDPSDPDCWTYSEVCALVADALGKDFMVQGEQEIAARLKLTRSPKLISRISKKASPPLMDDSGGGVTLLPEAYRGLLILGLGTSKVPFEPRDKQTQTGWLAESLAEQFGIDATKVQGRGFERAKREVLTRYEDHLKSLKRRELAVDDVRRHSGRVKSTQAKLLKLLFGAMFRSVKVGEGLSPGQRLALIRKGLPVPPLTRRPQHGRRGLQD